MAHALDAVRFLLSDTDPGKLGASLAEVAFVGRSNSGKSTMINALCRKDLARTSGTPGRTRTINVYEAAPQRRIVDLPGYGFATGPASSREGWGAMIEGYLVGSKTLAGIFVLVDAKLGPTKLDLEMLNWLQAESLPWRVVATKTDGTDFIFKAIVRLDTPVDVNYYRNGGILQTVLRKMAQA